MPIALFVEIVGIVLGLTVIGVGVTIGSHTVISFGSMCLAATGAYRLWLSLSQRDRYFSFCDIHVAGLLIAYFGGAAATLWLSFGGVLAYWNAPDLALFLVATVYSLLFYGCARLLGLVERRFWRKVWQSEDNSERWGGVLTAALVCMGIAQMYMLASGGITYMGTGFVEGQKVPYLPAAVLALSGPVPGILGWALGRAELRRMRLLFFTCLALAPLQLLFNVNFGRRSVLYGVIVFFVMFLWARGRGFNMRKVAVLGVLSLPFLYVIWLFFHALRIDSYTDIQFDGQFVQAYESRNIFERIGTTSNALSHYWNEFERDQAEAVVDRVFVIGFLTDLIGGTKVSSPYWGMQFVYSVVVAVPRFLYPEKHALLKELKGGEEHITVRFGLPPFDRADTVITEAYINFLWLGPFLYAPLLLGTGIALSWLARLGQSSFFRTLVVSSTLMAAIAAEASFVGTTLNVLRTLAVLSIPFMILNWLKPRARAAPAPSFVPRRAGVR